MYIALAKGSMNDELSRVNPGSEKILKLGRQRKKERFAFFACTFASKTTLANITLENNIQP